MGDGAGGHDKFTGAPAGLGRVDQRQQADAALEALRRQLPDLLVDDPAAAAAGVREAIARVAPADPAEAARLSSRWEALAAALAALPQPAAGEGS